MENRNDRYPSILYQNSSKTVTLIDIPTSIAVAQLPSTPGQLFLRPLRELLSCSPLQTPYPSLEPKSKKARANVLARQGAQVGNEDLQEVVHRGLEEIRRDYQGDWCLPRKLCVEGISRKRKRRDSLNGKPSEGGSEKGMEPDSQALSREDVASIVNSGPAKIVDLTSVACSSDDMIENVLLRGHSSSIIHNPTRSSLSIMIPTAPPSAYTLPTNSAFSLSHIAPSTVASFSAALSNLPQSPTARSHPPLSSKFSLIVLDPPWHNKSVTRSRHYSTQRDDPLSSLRPVLGAHIAANGIVACWITNKASARAEALECFRAWNIRLIEEWAWLKVTTKGEPVYEVGGVWKKPFEVLLVGKMMGGGGDDKGDRESIGNEPAERAELRERYGEGSIRRRLIVGVPDLHSRKPSLRTLMEPLVGKGCDYVALEVFARNLTAGWVAWGDEVLKFNWDGHWVDAKSNSGQSA